MAALTGPSIPALAGSERETEIEREKQESETEKQKRQEYKERNKKDRKKKNRQKDRDKGRETHTHTETETHRENQRLRHTHTHTHRAGASSVKLIFPASPVTWSQRSSSSFSLLCPGGFTLCITDSTGVPAVGRAEETQVSNYRMCWWDL